MKIMTRVGILEPIKNKMHTLFMTLKHLFGIIALLFSTALTAQNNYFYSYQINSGTKAVNLEGKSQLTVISPHDDLTTTISGKATGQFCAPTKNSDGLYTYTALFDLSQGREVKVMFARKGSPLQTEMKELLKPNQSIMYKVEEVKNPISLNEQTGRNMGSKVHGETDIEFTTDIEGLNVKVSPLLKSRVSKCQNAAGAQVITVSIVMKPMTDMIKKKSELKEEFDLLDQEMEDGKILSSDTAKLNRHKELEAVIEELDMQLSEMSQVTLSAPNSNTLSISIDNMSENERRAYAVLAMKQIENIYNTSYDQYLANAVAASKTRKFKAAADFYRQAAEAEDAPEEGKATCLQRAADMEQYFDFMDMANKALRRLKKEKEKGEMLDYGLVDECYNVAIKNYESLYQLTQDEELKKRVEVLEKARKKLGIVIEGTVVGIDRKGGVMWENPLTGVDIYAVPFGKYGASYTKGTCGDLVGSVDEKGHYHVQLESGKYEGLLFVPTDTKEYKKNAWRALKEQRHATIDVKFNK